MAEMESPPSLRLGGQQTLSYTTKLVEDVRGPKSACRRMPWVRSPALHKPGLALQDCNPTLKRYKERQRLQSEFKASLSYMSKQPIRETDLFLCHFG